MIKPSRANVLERNSASDRYVTPMMDWDCTVHSTRERYLASFCWLDLSPNSRVLHTNVRIDMREEGVFVASAHVVEDCLDLLLVRCHDGLKSNSLVGFKMLNQFMC